MLRWGPGDADEILAQHGEWIALAEGEPVEFAAKTRRDLLIFTDRRVVLTDTQGLLSRKTEYFSIPYCGVSRWSGESRGRDWMDGADLKVWVSSQQEPLVNLELQRDESARTVAELLAKHAL